MPEQHNDASEPTQGADRSRKENPPEDDSLATNDNFDIVSTSPTFPGISLIVVGLALAVLCGYITLPDLLLYFPALAGMLLGWVMVAAGIRRLLESRSKTDRVVARVSLVLFCLSSFSQNRVSFLFAVMGMLLSWVIAGGSINVINRRNNTGAEKLPDPPATRSVLQPKSRVGGWLTGGTIGIGLILAAAGGVLSLIGMEMQSYYAGGSKTDIDYLWRLVVGLLGFLGSVSGYLMLLAGAVITGISAVGWGLSKAFKNNPHGRRYVTAIVGVLIVVAGTLWLAIFGFFFDSNHQMGYREHPLPADEADYLRKLADEEAELSYDLDPEQEDFYSWVSGINDNQEAKQQLQTFMRATYGNDSIEIEPGVLITLYVNGQLSPELKQLIDEKLAGYHHFENRPVWNSMNE